MIRLYSTEDVNNKLNGYFYAMHLFNTPEATKMYRCEFRNGNIVLMVFKLVKLDGVQYYQVLSECEASYACYQHPNTHFKKLQNFDMFEDHLKQLCDHSNIAYTSPSWQEFFTRCCDIYKHYIYLV